MCSSLHRLPEPLPPHAPALPLRSHETAIRSQVKSLSIISSLDLLIVGFSGKHVHVPRKYVTFSSSACQRDSGLIVRVHRGLVLELIGGFRV